MPTSTICRGAFSFTLLLAGLAICSPAQSAVKVVKKAPAVKHVEFDPQNPGKVVPQLRPGETALCGSDFGAAARVGMQPRTQRGAGGRFLCSISVDEVQFELDLSITVWLPTGASDKIKAHEEGHRQISEKIYAEVANRAARVAGDTLDGKRFQGEADTAREAEKIARDAMSAAQTQMIQAYLDETSRAGKKIQEEYDTITRHGVNLELAEADAIKQSWEKFTPPLWVQPKAPATKPGAATRPAAPKTGKTLTAP